MSVPPHLYALMCVLPSLYEVGGSYLGNFFPSGDLREVDTFSRTPVVSFEESC